VQGLFFRLLKLPGNAGGVLANTICSSCMGFAIAAMTSPRMRDVLCSA